MILCSPSNPYGTFTAKKNSKDLRMYLQNSKQKLFFDENLRHINYLGKHESIAQFESVRDRVVIVNGVSKAYAMTGWRLGWIAGPKWIASACNTLQGQYTSGPCSVTQKAAEAAYTGDQSCLATMRAAFERRKNLVVSMAREIPGLKVNDPQGAFYVFPDASY